KTLTVTFLTGAAHPELGSALGIQLFSPVPAGSQVLFDNVRLDSTVETPPNIAEFFLHGTGPNNNPPALFLDNSDPTATIAKFKDSVGVNFSGGNPWKEIGIWSANPETSAEQLTALSD